MEPEHERDAESAAFRIRDLLPFLGLIFVAAAALPAVGFGIGFGVGRYHACPQPLVSAVPLGGKPAPRPGAGSLARARRAGYQQLRIVGLRA